MYIKVAFPPHLRYYVNGALLDHRQGSEILPEASSEWITVRSALASHRLRNVSEGLVRKSLVLRQSTKENDHGVIFTSQGVAWCISGLQSY